MTDKKKSTPKRLMLVAESPKIREQLLVACHSDLRLDIVALFGSAEAALAFLQRNEVDIICFDIELPGINGVQFCEEVMAKKPIPMAILASASSPFAIRYAMSAIRAGALEAISYPNDQDIDFAEFVQNFTNLLVLLSEIKFKSEREQPSSVASSVQTINRARMLAIGIGASIGGPKEVVTLLQALEGIEVPIFLVQHLAPEFLESFVVWLTDATPFEVYLAQDGDIPKPGLVYHPPANYHMELKKGVIRLSQQNPVSFHRPSISLLFSSLAKSYGASCAGILLTGIGDDGAQGLKAIHDAGGLSIVEHESTAIVSGMAQAAMNLGAAASVLPLSEIASFVSHKIGKAS